MLNLKTDVFKGTHLSHIDDNFKHSLMISNTKQHSQTTSNMPERL